MKTSLLLLLLFSLRFASNEYIYPRKPECGYKSCPAINPNQLNVHIVCHTHLDTGWVETYDDYYFRYVRDIIDSVVKNLYEFPNRKFIFVETSFFSRWWNEQNDVTKNRVYWLVQTGQLEFISGGWAMNDEATPRYQSIIDQMTYGHRWLNKVFGECGKPKIGWQIDPFGHSREMASIFAQIGFDGLFLGRIDYQDKYLRESTKTMEFIWKSSPSLGKKADLFTGILPNVYWPPSGFCYDVNCFDEQIYDYNADRKAKDFIKLVREQAQKYGTNNTIITMGMDFYYRDANKWYTNLDRLMAAVNKLQHEEGVNVFYSTPSCYLKSLHDSRRQWPVKLDDFFPYADKFNSYWTGYFTSRPALKLNVEYSNNVLQAAKQLCVLANLGDMYVQKINKLTEAMGILLHHDGITGTSKQAVAEDFSRMLSNGVSSAEEVMSEALSRIWLNEGIIATSPIQFCNELNISQCLSSETITYNSDVILTIYNPVAHMVKSYVRLPVIGSGFRVRDASGAIIASQMVPNHFSLLRLPERASKSHSTLLFRAMLPPLGFTSFVIDKVDSGVIAQPNQMSQVYESPQFYEEATISNGRVSVHVDGQLGLLKSITLKDGRKVDISQNFYIYQSAGKLAGEKPSGAYAFNPSDFDAHPATQSATFKVLRGPLVEEIHQQFSPWISQTIRVYQHVDYIEFDWIVGPIPIDSWSYSAGQEIISRFITSFNTNGTFFTDSNGRETLRRIRNQRPTWNLDTTETVASNYYPVTSWMFIRDYKKDLQLTVIPDRAQGGTSLNDGQVELMVHRRLLHDDGFGVEEALNEPGVDRKGLIVRGKHRVFVNDIQESIRQMRIMSKTLTNRPIFAFRRRPVSPRHKARSTMYSHSTNDYSTYVGLNRKLPANIHLLTLEPLEENRVLLRLEHFFEINEDLKYSRPRRVSLRDLFTPFRITEAYEMNLSANEEKKYSDYKRFKFVEQFDPYLNYTNVLDEIDNEDLELINN
ncbi:lysosomal alpha-mannosidase-like protein [Leptotrombidium deliense]|uniref:Alpha-mannosidase n=1 Tax=Leptotrombidium deliense TaxID=299467 RepID=A0A443SLW4_9ACAR|nr:lysosomal alpha-mannosidase-like protein [Leptotrombidium deliense]